MPAGTGTTLPAEARRLKPSEAEATASAALRRRRRRDRRARRAITVGGMAIILVILAILGFVAFEVAPLLRPARVEPGAARPVAGGAPLVLATDEYRSLVVTLGGEGTLRLLAAGTLAERQSWPAAPGPDGAPEPLVHCWQNAASPEIGGVTAGGRVVQTRLRWDLDHDGATRVSALAEPRFSGITIDTGGRAIVAAAGRLDSDLNPLAAVQLADGKVLAVRRKSEENAFTGEKSESTVRMESASPAVAEKLVIDRDGRMLYGGTGDGRLLAWRIRDDALDGPDVVGAGPAAVTALGFLIGDQSLIVGQADGSLSQWTHVRGPGEIPVLTRIRSFAGHEEPIRLLAASSRDKGFLALDAGGRLALHHATSGRLIWIGDSPVREATALGFGAKADGAFVAGAGRLAAIEIDNPHPQAGIQAFFGEVWYEGYDRPAHVWQSSSGNDDYEPKLGLVPLLVGTLKGTLFSLLLAVPVAVLGAMFASQFMHPSLKRVVKPAVEIMASLPSVVLGFIAGLWLAPRMARVLPAVFLMILVLPVAVILTGAAWRRLPQRIRGRFRAGTEVVPFMAAIVLGAGMCLALDGVVENVVFGGDYRSWLDRVLGLHFDQNNAIVVSLAMGFAVIPIIFTISEEAFSNVPRGLVLGSLALGANRWQTVTRVVLPTASPGIFSAVMVGFGRAVGETMIVLMAAGNTPILDWNPFNGFRTLSANIATEIGEAPEDGTLYRTLFLAALLLFVLTFAVNTAAELVRDRLRRRYANL